MNMLSTILRSRHSSSHVLSKLSKTTYRNCSEIVFPTRTLIWQARKDTVLHPRWYSSSAKLNQEPSKSNRPYRKEYRQKLYRDTKERTQNAVKKALDRMPKPKNPVFRENIYTFPNFLTFSRLVSAPVIGYLVLKSNHVWAAPVFIYACFTDLLDGFIARKYGLQSIVGSVLDPMADKILMVTLTGCLAWIGNLPIWIATIIFGRDFLLGLSAIYYRYVSLPPPKTMKRYWDFSIPSAEVRPTTISKYNTALQMGLIAVSVLKPLALPSLTVGSQALALQAISGLEYIVAATTILSGLSYVFSKTAVKILTEEEIEERRLNQLTLMAKSKTEKTSTANDDKVKK
ncbi:CDP-alcohol phosphatidyltransferase-domain-containing protein [Lipomyces chichibuensis]|uniref:CDP-alcohol phosphatidyltransferase-domain-containing protein n=1 Tax=Lipomyces chichibuensis TaxID=1546026 RepID=UPI0033431843